MARFMNSIVLCLSLVPGVLCTVTTVENQEVLEGQSITIPCHYNPEYTQNVKYWCWGYSRSFCTTLARTDDPHSTPSSNARVTIIDDPTQQVFTVKMRELKEEDSGWYRCAVEVGNIWTADSTGNLYITVKHGMSVMNSTVSGEEGGSVTVHVLYSLKHRENKKLWCRSGDLSSCEATNSSGIFSSSSLLISDDRISMVTVTMSNLEKRDAGWYWLSSAEQKVPVQVLVTPRPTTTSSPSLVKLIGLTTPCPWVAKAENSHWHQPVLLTMCGTLLLLILVVVAWKRSLLCKKRSGQQRLTEDENSLTMSPNIGVSFPEVDKPQKEAARPLLTLRALYTIFLPLGVLALLLLVILVIVVICMFRKKRMEYQTRTRKRSNDLSALTAESEPSYSSVVFKSRTKTSEQSNLKQGTPLQPINTTSVYVTR